MQDAGILRTAVMAVNDARTKTMFDNRYGTGQSCVFAIADLLEERGIALTDQPALVLGYGPSAGASRRTCARSAPRCGSPRPTPCGPRGAARRLSHRPGARPRGGALVVSATGVPATVTARSPGRRGSSPWPGECPARSLRTPSPAPCCSAGEEP